MILVICSDLDARTLLCTKSNNDTNTDEVPTIFAVKDKSSLVSFVTSNLTLKRQGTKVFGDLRLRSTQDLNIEIIRV